MTDLHLQHGAAHLHHLGPRAVGEFLAEIGRECGCSDRILDRLNAWRSMHTSTLRQVGDDRIPVRLRLVPRDLMEER
jgi:hypothetical protein